MIHVNVLLKFVFIFIKSSLTFIYKIRFSFVFVCVFATFKKKIIKILNSTK